MTDTPPPLDELRLALEKAKEPKPHRQVKEWMAGRADDAACRQWQERVRAAELELLAALPQLLDLAAIGLLVREAGPEVVEKVARAFADSDGVKLDRKCLHEEDEETDDMCGYEDCPAAIFEDHDVEHARSYYRSRAATVLAALKDLSNAPD